MAPARIVAHRSRVKRGMTKKQLGKSYLTGFTSRMRQVTFFLSEVRR